MILIWDLAKSLTWGSKGCVGVLGNILKSQISKETWAIVKNIFLFCQRLVQVRFTYNFVMYKNLNDPH